MLNLIKDRTAQDVARWKVLKAKPYETMTASERSEWLSGKGAYNYTDMNRVEDAVFYLNDLLAQYNYGVKLLDKRKWTATDVPTVSDMTRYIENVKRIREALAQFSDTPPTPASMQRLTYTVANNIEQILADVELLVANMVASFTVSGEIFGGEM